MQLLQTHNLRYIHTSLSPVVGELPYSIRLCSTLIRNFLNLQGVVTYISPISLEAFATGITWSFHSEALDCHILWGVKGQNAATPPYYLRNCIDQLMLVNSEFVLIPWSTNVNHLIPFDPSHKRFYRRPLALWRNLTIKFLGDIVIYPVSTENGLCKLQRAHEAK